ncbi:MAG: ParB/RepB/Spo0J family partition protein, partial [Acidimicrobiales bacterium]
GFMDELPVSEPMRRRLGRGLSALLGSSAGSEPEAQESTVDNNSMIHVELIDRNPFQPRRDFEPNAITELTDSIRQHGVLQPLLVREVDEGSYELIAGERRLRAARRAGLPTVPVLVREADDLASLEQAVVENLHRQDLNPLEEAAAYQQLIEDFSLTHDALAARVGRSRVTITNMLRLFQLPPSIQKMVGDGTLTAGHARALLGTPDRAFQEALANRIVKEGLSVRAVEDAVRERGGAMPVEESGASPSSPAAPKLRQAGMHELEQLLSEHLSTRVHVQEGRGGGKVVVEFADLDDLERLYRIIIAGD